MPLEYEISRIREQIKKLQEELEILLECQKEEDSDGR